MQITPTSAVPAIQPIPRATGTAADAVPTTPTAPVRLLNPQPVIDPALGIVVTEYFNRAGNLTSQYPTERALENYRVHGLDGTTGGTATESRPGALPLDPAKGPPLETT